jgi:hypothetical protein
MQLFATLDMLAAPEDQEFGIFKVIVPIIIAVFWVIAQILSSIGSKKKDRTPPAEAEYPVSLPPEAPVPQRQPKQQRQVKHRADTRQQRERQRQQQRVVPPPLQVRAQPRPAVQATAPVTADSTDAIAATQLGASSSRKSDAGPNANQRLRALLRPKNLKKEFILTEILQSPVGMRRDRV